MKQAGIPEPTFKKLHGADLESARLTPKYGCGHIGFSEDNYHLNVDSTEA